jgi:hypothetical protein
VFTLEHFNGHLGVVARAGTTVVSVLALSTAEGVVTSLQLIANPEKLVSLDDPGIGLV